MISLNPTKFQLGYKLLRGGASFVQSESRGKTEYFSHYWTERRRTKDGKLYGALAVFRTEGEADRFMSTTYRKRDAEIWRCVYQPSRTEYMWYFSSIGTKHRLHISHAPRGTRLADYVFLLEKVNK